jgi:RNA polymerase sigma factor (sigma-70 family)
MPMMTNDSQMPACDAQDRDGDAFQRLVERHIDFVYATALRQTRDPQLAEDITQAVFLLLAQRANRLKAGTMIKGWLFNATRYVVANYRRAKARRKFHEREAAVMRSEIVREDHCSDILAHLDDAIAGLSEKDRRVLLLRFFEDMPLEGLGRTLGISEEAAKKRVARAVERLRHLLVGRGAAVTGASLGAVLQASTAQAAPTYLAKATVDLVRNGTSVAGNSGSAFSLAKGAAKMMMRARVKSLAIQCAIAGISIGTAVVLATSQSRLVPPSPVQPAAVAMADAADTPKVADEDFDACCQALKSIVAAFDHNDLAAVQAAFYFKPGSDPKTIDVMGLELEMQVAAYRLKNAAVSRFGMHGTMLVTDFGTAAEAFLEWLSRIGPENARVLGDTLTITPAAHTGPNAWYWKAPIYFVRDQGAWKLDAGRTFRVTFRAVRRQRVADESPEQQFAAAIHLMSGQFDTIADDIDKGNIPDEAEAQKRVNAAWSNLNSQFREFNCNLDPG